MPACHGAFWFGKIRRQCELRWLSSRVNNLYLILKKCGKLYFSVPVGPQRIEFDAHRVFSISYLLELFDGKYHIDLFSLVDDHGELHENVPITETNAQNNFDCVYGCGIFEMTKL